MTNVEKEDGFKTVKYKKRRHEKKQRNTEITDEEDNGIQLME